MSCVEGRNLSNVSIDRAAANARVNMYWLSVLEALYRVGDTPQYTRHLLPALHKTSHKAKPIIHIYITIKVIEPYWHIYVHTEHTKSRFLILGLV